MCFKRNTRKKNLKNKEGMDTSKTKKTRMDYFMYFVMGAVVIQLLLLIYQLMS